MKKIIVLVVFTIALTNVWAQNILVYHPRTGESIKLYNSDKKPFDGKSLHFRQGEKFRIRILNPNPLFYKYELKYEEQEEESQDKSITDALALLSTVLSSRIAKTGRSEIEFEQYKGAVNTLIGDIRKAQGIIDGSDVPELELTALQGDRSAGLKYAVDQILGTVQPGVTLELLDVKYRFRSPSLAEDLDELKKKIVDLDEVLDKALTLLNNSLVQKINEMKKIVSDLKTEIDSEFVVGEKKTKVMLAISPTDTKKKLARVVTGDAAMEIVTIIPDYKRSTLELVPVGNFLFAKDLKEFYIENDVIKSRSKSKTIFQPGVELNINLVSFGYSKEMSAAIGLGYKFSDEGDTFDNLYLSTLFSYKNFFRIGAGFGFASYPDGLKNGLKEGDTMPEDVANLEDVIEYREKPTVFITLAFTGLNLTKKK